MQNVFKYTYIEQRETNKGEKNKEKELKNNKWNKWIMLYVCMWVKERKIERKWKKEKIESLSVVIGSDRIYTSVSKMWIVWWNTPRQNILNIGYLILFFRSYFIWIKIIHTSPLTHIDTYKNIFSFYFFSHPLSKY